MAHDTDFAGKQLRLAAFLRVVENGMPQRPSRFRRHGQTLDAPNISSHSDAVISKAAIEDSMVIQATESVLLPTTDQPVSETRRARQLRIQAAATPGTNSKKEFSTQRRSPKLRKRRLPVNELALLRTTTSDGLPSPCDASAVFAAAVTDLDPIGDSQTLYSSTPAWLAFQLPYCSMAFRQPKINPTQTPVPRRGNVAEVKPKGLQASRYRLGSPPRSCYQKSKSIPGFDGGSSGFTGSELLAVPKKGSRKRCSTVSATAKHTTIGKCLVLSSGLLPMPVLESTLGQTQIPSQPTSSNSPYGFRTTPTLPPEVNGTPVNYEEEYLSHGWESTIHNQLCSVTAPARHDSESSELDYEAEAEWCTEDEEVGNSVNLDDDHRAFSQHETQTSTYVDDISDFEAATQHLDMAVTNARGDDCLYS